MTTITLLQPHGGKTGTVALQEVQRDDVTTLLFRGQKSKNQMFQITPKGHSLRAHANLTQEGPFLLLKHNTKSRLQNSGIEAGRYHSWSLRLAKVATCQLPGLGDSHLQL